MKATEIINEKWSKKYKRSIDCNNPKGFSQRAHCQGRKKTDETVDTDLQNELLDEDLRKWFKEKWVRFGPDGKIRGACARGSKSEGKPKCLPQSKAHSLGKKGRKYAASKKRREDPNPERRGKAKNVATKKKKSNESVQQIDELKCWPGYTRVKGVKAGAPGSCKKKTKEGYSAGTTGGNGLGISKSPIVKVIEKPLIEKKTTEAIDLKKLVTNPKKLKTYKTHISAEEAFRRLQNGENHPMLFDVIAKDPEYSYQYANFVLKDRFPLGEPTIAKSPMYSLLYANYVLKDRFKLGEPAIMKDNYYAIQYQRTHFPNKRWPEFEPMAAKNANIAYPYARGLNKPFKLGEPIIAQDPYIAVLYAKNVLKDRFKMAEPVIAKSSDNAYLYARDVLGGRFKLGEPAIAEDPDMAIRYARDILRGRFKLAEPALMKSILRNNYFNLLVDLRIPSKNLRNKYEVEEGQIYSTGGGAGESYRIMKPKHVDHYDDTLEGKVFKGLQREDEYSESKVFKGLQNENTHNKGPYSMTNKPPGLSVLNTFIQVLNKPNNRYTPEYILDHYNRLYGLNHSVLSLKQIAKTIPYKLEELEDALIKGERLYGSSTR